MPPLLTASAQVTCCHGTGFLALVPKQAKVLAGGSPVMCAGDIAPAPVAGCPIPPPPAPSKPCTTATVFPVPGVTVSRNVMVGGKPVHIGNPTLQGITDGAPVPCPMVMVQFPGQTTVMSA